MKKIQSTKINQNKAKSNQLAVVCKLSKEKIYNKTAICLNIKSNNTAYISNKYLQHKIFDSIDISNNGKIDILTLVYLGCEIVNTKNQIKLSINDFTNQTANYIITLKNNLQINIYDSDAKAKKYFNILKNYKKSIQSIQYTITTATKINIYNLIDLQTYPPFAKKFKSYQMGLSYNPLSKNDCIEKW